MIEPRGDERGLGMGAGLSPQARAWLAVLGGFLVHLILGTLYLWANTTSAITSYLRSYDPSVTYDDTISVFATTLAAQGCTMLLGGLMAQRLGPRTTCLIGACIMVVGNLGASFCTTLAGIIICHGMMMGLGTGICYTAPIAAAVKHLPHKKGLVTGIIVGGFGCGAFIFGFFALNLVNPRRESVDSAGADENYFPPGSDVVARVPYMYRVLALTYAVALAAGILCISEPDCAPPTLPAEAAEAAEAGGGDAGALGDRGVLSKILAGPKQQYHSTASVDLDSRALARGEVGNPMVELATLPGDEERPDDHLPRVGNAYATVATLDCSSHAGGSMPGACEEPPRRPAQAQGASYSIGELVRMPITYHVMSCFITTTVGGMYLAGTFKTYAQAYFHDEGYLVAVSSSASVFNFLGRVVWGAVSDRAGAASTLLGMSALFSLAILTYSSSVLLGEAGFALYTFLIFFCEGGNFVLYVPLTIQLFGQQHSASNYGMIFSAYSLFVVANITVLARLHVTFRAASLLMGSLTLLGCLNVALLRRHMQSHLRREEPGPEECKQR